MARTPSIPQEILADELEELGLSPPILPPSSRTPNRLYQILSGKRNLTADTALRLGQYFGAAHILDEPPPPTKLDLARRKSGRDPAHPRRAETPTGHVAPRRRRPSA
ncbi:MAG: addiction module antidote protein, HigA family [Bryobacterales bacterium]|nr:addiction module antidote protein, HigA family [Bryobacterales bacterium]